MVTYSPTRSAAKTVTKSTANVSGLVYPTFAAGSKLVSALDSITQQEHYAESLKVENRGSSILHWASRDFPWFKHCIWYDATATGGASPPLFRGANFGLAGDTATGMSNRMTPLINTNPDLLLLLGGTNIGPTDTLPATVIASLQSIIDDCEANDIHVILGTILPRVVEDVASPSGNKITPALMNRILEINNWIRAQGSSTVTIWDAWYDLIDTQYSPGDALYGTPWSWVTRDDVHLTPRGCYTAAKSLRTILMAMRRAETWFNTAHDDSDNILSAAASRFEGSGGSAQDGVTGTVATGWAIDNIDGGAGSVSAVASVIANAQTGGQTQRLVITSDGLGSSADNVETISVTPLGYLISEASLSDGDWCQYMFSLSVSSNAVLGSLQTLLRNTTTGVIGRGMGSVIADRTAQPWPHDQYNAWIVTEPVQYNTSDVYNPQLYIDVLQTEAGSVTIDMDKALLRKVEDPQVLFPYTT